MQDGEQRRLLDRVRIWFDAPEQVQHYQNEASRHVSRHHVAKAPNWSSYILLSAMLS
jgi:hypothetical protein